MKPIFKFFAERHLLSHLVTIMVVLVGLFSAAGLNRSELPKVDYGVMTVAVHYPGASPEDVELNVTNKLEDELKTVTGIKRMLSVSTEDHAGIRLILDPTVPDREKVKDNIREAVARVSDLPLEVKESPRIEEETSNGPILAVGITGDLPYPELREYARLLEKKLKAVPGVAQVDMDGYRAREIKIEVSPDKIMKYRIPLWEIMAAIQTRNIRKSGGTLESYTSERNVVTLAQFRKPDDVGEVIVRATPGGAMIRVKDLAQIDDDFAEETVMPRFNGKTTIAFEITKNENADILRTANAVKALIEQEKTQLPPDSKLRFVWTDDESTYVKNKLDIVLSNGAMGLGLVILVLAIFLNLRGALWVALGIPFTMLGALILFPLFDMELDSVTLTSLILVLGMIVDDAIIISENIFRRREQGELPLEAAVNGIHEVYLPVFTTIATTFLAFLPMFFMKGELGLFVRFIPLVISLALALSLCESFFVLPAHLLPGLRSKDPGKTQSFSRAWFRPVRDGFESFMLMALKLRYLWTIVAVVFLIGSLLYFSTSMDFILFPAKAANAFYGRLELPAGSSLQATSDIVKNIEAILDKMPDEEIQSYSFYIGAGEFFDNPHSARFEVHLTPYSERERSAEEIVADVRAKTAALQGIEKLTFHIENKGVDSGEPIQVAVAGSDEAMRTKLADDIVAFLQKTEGVTDITRNDRSGKEEVNIEMNYERLARYGLTVEDVAQNVRVAYDGEVVTSVRYGEEDVEFRVMIEERYRQQLDYLRQLRIPNRQGEMIALDEVASFNTQAGPSHFPHFGGERMILISAEVQQGVTTPLKVLEQGMRHFTPERLHAEYPGARILSIGEAEETRKAMIDLYITFGLAALGIYFLLMLLFDSVTQPLIVILAIPFGISGVIIAYALHGEPFSFLGLMGVVGMAGVVVNDSLVLVEHLNELIRNRGTENLVHVIAAGTANRLRPIILTTATTVAGLLPLAYGLGGHDIYMAPMALALGYGLLFATPITLVLIPSLYLIGYDIRRVLKKILQ